MLTLHPSMQDEKLQMMQNNAMLMQNENRQIISRKHSGPLKYAVVY